MDFGALLLERIEAKGYTRERFAAAVHTSTAQVSRVIRGQRTPALDVVEAWATHLGITGAERERFLALAAITHVPRPEYRERLAKLVERSDEQDAAISDLRRQVAELRQPYKP